MAGDAVVIALAERYSRIAGIEFSSKNLIKTGNGKPGFKAGPQFSVSHSGDYWLCAFNTDAVGVDLQQHTGCSRKKIAGRFFHTDENRFIGDNPDRFFLVWTAKEAYVKLTGQGITDEFSKFSVIDEQGKFSRPDAYFQHIPCKKGYSLCLCTQNARQDYLVITE